MRDRIVKQLPSKWFGNDQKYINYTQKMSKNRIQGTILEIMVAALIFNAVFVLANGKDRRSSRRMIQNAMISQNTPVIYLHVSESVESVPDMFIRLFFMPHRYWNGWPSWQSNHPCVTRPEGMFDICWDRMSPDTCFSVGFQSPQLSKV